MWVGERDAGGLAMITKQGPYSGGCHALAACGAFQRDEQRGGTGVGPLQPEIVIEELNGLWRQWKEPKLVAFAANAELAFGKQQVIAIQGQNFRGAQSLHEHQTDNREIASQTETGPEPRHLIDRQRHAGTPGSLHAQSAHRYSRAAK